MLSELLNFLAKTSPSPLATRLLIKKRVPTTTLLDLGFYKKLVRVFRKDPPKIQKTDFLNTKMVEIDPKSLETKSLKISASEVLHNKIYSNTETP